MRIFLFYFELRKERVWSAPHAKYFYCDSAVVSWLVVDDATLASFSVDETIFFHRLTFD